MSLGKFLLEAADLVTFTEEILNEKLHFLSSDSSRTQFINLYCKSIDFYESGSLTLRAH